MTTVTDCGCGMPLIESTHSWSTIVAVSSPCFVRATYFVVPPETWAVGVAATRRSCPKFVSKVISLLPMSSRQLGSLPVARNGVPIVADD